MSKKLNEDAMHNELAGSAFFQSVPEPNPSADLPAPTPPPSIGLQPSPPLTPADRRPTIHRMSQRSNERTKIRHSFDIFPDQLLSLREIAVEREKRSGAKVLMGDLVQEALDRFIAHERNSEPS